MAKHLNISTASVNDIKTSITEMGMSSHTGSALKLGDRLVAAGHLTRDQVEDAAREQRINYMGAKIGEVLVKLKLISQHTLNTILDAHLKSADPSKAKNQFDMLEMAKILLDMGVKQSHVKAAMLRSQMTGEPLPRIMRDFGFLSQEQVAEAISYQTGFVYFGVENLDSINLDSIKDLKLDEFRGFAPVGKYTEEGETFVVVAVPDASFVNQARNEFIDYKTKAVVASEYTIQSIYRRFFARSEKQFDEAVDAFLSSLNSRKQEEDPGLVRNIFGALLRHACYSGASDLYLYKSEYVGVIKLKINGVGHLFRSVPNEVYDRLLNKLVTDNARSEDLRKEPKEAVVEFSEDEKKKYDDIVTRYGFRLELAESRGERTAVIRVLDKQSAATDLDKLGFDDHTNINIKRYLNSSTGLVLVTGPTGSGKTTSLYAMLKAIDPVERSVQSIENPIEYRHGLWIQYELRKDTNDEGDEANKWLKALLRNAPDVILMGEVRDAKIANILLDAANTGHLVFTTLHTNTAALALARLKRFDLDMDSLASVLLGVLAQRLVRVLCPYCKEPDTRPSTSKELMAPYLSDAEKKPYKAGAGCSNCSDSGYRGRRIIYELLDVNQEVRKLIESDSPPSDIANAGIPTGQSMWASGLKLVAGGFTSIDEVARVAVRDM